MSDSTDLDYVINAISRNEKRAKRAGWPGMPISNFPMSVFPTLNKMITDGVLIEHKQASRTTPGKSVSYVSIAAK